MSNPFWLHTLYTAWGWILLWIFGESGIVVVKGDAEKQAYYILYGYRGALQGKFGSCHLCVVTAGFVV